MSADTLQKMTDPKHPERVAFEALRALFGRGYTASNGWFDLWPNGIYKRVETQAAWEGWLMGRKASQDEVVSSLSGLFKTGEEP